MSGIETAIRNALSKSDRADAGVRARIYQSARQAVDAGLHKQGVSDPQAIAHQHALLERLIGQIETEEEARLDPALPADLFDVSPEPPEAVAVPAMETPVRLAPESGDLGGFGAERLDERRGGTRQARPAPAVTEERRADAARCRPEAREQPAGKKRRRRGAGFFASLLVYGLLLAALGGGGWWFLQSGLVDDVKAVLNGERPSSQTPATPAADDGDTEAQFRGLRTLDPRNGFGDDWVDVLKPGDVGGVSADGATVEAVSTSDGPAVRISGGNAEIAVPEAVLQEMSGKPSTIAITLQSPGNTPSQVAVECDFASLGHCGRHRFTVGNDRADILVHVVFDRTMAPTKPGRLRLLADLEDKGRGVNVFAVRVLPGR